MMSRRHPDMELACYLTIFSSTQFASFCQRALRPKATMGSMHLVAVQSSSAPFGG